MACHYLRNMVILNILFADISVRSATVGTTIEDTLLGVQRQTADECGRGLP